MENERVKGIKVIIIITVTIITTCYIVMGWFTISHEINAKISILCVLQSIVREVDA